MQCRSKPNRQSLPTAGASARRDRGTLPAQARRRRSADGRNRPEPGSRLLAAAIQRHGLAWDKVKQSYQDSSGCERTTAALQQQWRCIARRHKPKGVIAAAIKVADAYQRPLRRGMWTPAEVDVLRQGMAQTKRVREICDDYEDKFPTSKRSRRAVQAKIEQMRADDRSQSATKTEDLDHGLYHGGVVFDTAARSSSECVSPRV